MGLPGPRAGHRRSLLPGRPQAAGAGARGQRSGGRARDPHVPAPRGGARLQLCLHALRVEGVAGPLRPLRPPLPRRLHAGSLLAQIRAAHRRLVRAEAPRRGLRRDLRGLADAGLRLEAPLRGMAGAEEAAVRRADCPRAGHPPPTQGAGGGGARAARRGDGSDARAVHKEHEQDEGAALADLLPDAELEDIFVRKGEDLRSASAFLLEHRKTIVDKITYWTGVRRPLVRKLVEIVGKRARELELSVERKRETQVLIEVVAFATTLAMNYLTRGRFAER